MSSDSKVSIIVPVYNAEKYLSRCIESLLSQSYSNIELIIVDDCSIDSSFEISKSYQQKDNRVRILKHSSNLGPMRARDNGRIEAGGGWVGFIDADDWLPTDAIEKMLNIANSTKADVVSGVMVGLSINGEALSIFENKLPYGNTTDGVVKALVHGDLHHNLAGKLFKKELFNHDLKIYDNATFAEDALVFYQVAGYIKKMELLNDVVYFYSRGTSATPRGRKMSDKQICNMCLYWSYVLGDFVNAYPDLRQIVIDKTFFEIVAILKQGFSKHKIYSNITINYNLDKVYNITYIFKKSHGIMKIINLLLFNIHAFGLLCSRVLY